MFRTASLLAQRHGGVYQVEPGGAQSYESPKVPVRRSETPHGKQERSARQLPSTEILEQPWLGGYFRNPNLAAPTKLSHPK